MQFSWMLETQKALYRLNCAFDPLSVASTKNTHNNLGSNKSADSWNKTDCLSILGLAELNLNTGKNLQERLLGGKGECPKDVIEILKSPEELAKLQLDTPAEEGLRQVNQIWVGAITVLLKHSYKLFLNLMPCSKLYIKVRSNFLFY
jgi:hypothetical protein